MTIGPPLSTPEYPFTKLNNAKQRAIARGIHVIDFGQGDPRDETPAFIRQAIIDGITPQSSYPRPAGIPELRDAIAAWIQRRFNTAVSADNILPTFGSKEVLHSLPAYTLSEGRDTVVVPTPAYPVYERGATFHGANVHPLVLSADNDFLFDLDSVADDVWQRTALMWVNYPHNPTSATAPLEYLRRLVELAQHHDFTIAFDEAYSEIWFDNPPASALELGDQSNVVVVNTLSKRSCMTGYRSGFITGDPRIVHRIRDYRASVGSTPQDFVQHASAAAWGDESHVEEMRARWAAKRNLLLPVLRDKGLDPWPGDATFFLWFPVPAGETGQDFATRLLEAGIVLSPGSFFGEGGERFARLALVPTLDECRIAADRLAEIL